MPDALGDVGGMSAMGMMPGGMDGSGSLDGTGTTFDPSNAAAVRKQAV